MPSKHAFVALQDRYVSSLAVACCPTMDLIAVLTLEHHLVVHRTTSWQKLLHINPSDVSFEMMTLAWRPDGLQLAVGCDDGDVAIFEIESGEILPQRRSNFCHKHCITAMHWAQATRDGTLNRDSTAKRRRRKVCGAVGNFWSSHDTMSQSKVKFQHRASRFLGDDCKTAHPDTLLVTADERGFIALWWMGRVLLTRIDVSKHFTDDEFRILDSMGHQRGEAGGFRVEQVSFAPDLSFISVVLVFMGDGSGQAGKAVDEKESKLYRILALDMTAVCDILEDVALVANIIDCVNTLFDQIALYSRQVSTEWKNATRIFELKMGLIGLLYEKYACEDLPQEDMLSVLVTGITPPALAQYFAQDIQEMSVYRMQKAIFSGCESLTVLAESKVKPALVKVQFLLSELRGHARWNENYAATLGITTSALDDLVQATQDALVELEALILAIHETHQDFALFFQWILERVRIHTNSNRSRGEASATANGGRDVKDPSGSKSLLNLRRLCDFLQRAAKAAQHFRLQQSSDNVYKVETTFGNLLSFQLAARPIPLKGNTENLGVGFPARVTCIQHHWLVLLDTMAETLALATRREKSGGFTIGNASNTVEECHLHFRQPFSKLRLDEIAKNDDQSDDEQNCEETIDWNSLNHYGCMRDDQAECNTMMAGFRLHSGVLLLLRASQGVDYPHLRHKSPLNLIWDAAVISFSGGSSADIIRCQSFDFYGDRSLERQQMLAFVVNHTVDGQVHEEWLYLQSYDNVEFSHTKLTGSFEAIIAQSVIQPFNLDHSRGRVVASPSTSSQSAKNVTSVISAAARGVLCVILPPNRLVVFDAEDCEDDDSENEDVVTD
ncbi:unnamed protein product [Peronospora belbahrii]|uniref:Anaphase-promoting complex subunit 4 n=1 Tax=Peronospora belbahrii TaxID=622444 RepID=A0AAU9LAE3_9STRA|nr:unnamed protein product [Peronospora belbahrii]CAH0520905.1 unnamed protein product [Peronospora belbahrii]